LGGNRFGAKKLREGGVQGYARRSSRSQESGSSAKKGRTCGDEMASSEHWLDKNCLAPQSKEFERSLWKGIGESAVLWALSRDFGGRE